MEAKLEEHKRKKKREIISRLGRKPVEIPAGVKVVVNNGVVEVEGSRGKLSYSIPSLIEVKVAANQILLSPKFINRESKSFHGLARKLVLNMVDGVTTGFHKKLVIEGVGFRTQIAGDKLTMTLGFSHPVVYGIPKGIKVSVDPKSANVLVIEGNDKQKVGQVTAEIRAIKKPEPYKGTGIRYEDEVIKRKAGKAAVGAATGGAGGAKK